MSYVEYKGEDPISTAMLAELHKNTVQYTQLEHSLAAADGDKEAAVKLWMDTTDHLQASKLRTQIENATNKLRELAEQNVEVKTLSDEEKATAQAELDKLKDTIKTGFEVIEKVIKTMSPDPDGVRASLNTLDNPVKSNRGRKPGSTGSNLPRVSATVSMVGGNFKEPQKYDSFSQVANVLNVEVADLQKAFAEAAGVAHEDIKSVKTSVTFEYTPHHPNASTYTLTTTPKERKPRGSSGKSEEKPAESPAEETSAEEKSEESAA